MLRLVSLSIVVFGTVLAAVSLQARLNNKRPYEQAIGNIADERGITDKQKQAKTEPAATSDRSKENVAWFLAKHGRQLKRIAGTKPRIDLMTAENWIMRDRIVAIYKKNLEDCVEPKTLSYMPGLGGDPQLLEAAALFINRFFKPRKPVTAKQIVAGAGCNAIIENLLYDVCDRGDGLLIEVPYWAGFETCFVLRTQVQQVHVYPPSSPSPEALVAQYQKALAQANRPIKAILFCNPHNPKGTVYPQSHIEALLQFCEQNDLHFISDEIYGLSVFNTTATGGFVSVLQIDLEALGVNPNRVHMVYSISKDLGSSGLRTGFLVTQTHDKLRLSAAIANHSHVSTLNSAAITRLLRDDATMDSLIADTRTGLAEAARAMADFLSFHKQEFLPPVAGVFVWARLGGSQCTWAQESQLQDRLEECGVSMSAGSGYYAVEPGWFRMNFALKKDTMLQALRNIEDALGLTHRWSPKEE